MAKPMARSQVCMYPQQGRDYRITIQAKATQWTSRVIPDVVTRIYGSGGSGYELSVTAPFPDCRHLCLRIKGMRVESRMYLERVVRHLWGCMSRLLTRKGGGPPRRVFGRVAAGHNGPIARFSPTSSRLLDSRHHIWNLVTASRKVRGHFGVTAVPTEDWPHAQR